MTPEQPETDTSADLEGRVLRTDDFRTTCDAVERAFHYRGDVTIVRRSTGASLCGYVYDRAAEDEAHAVARLIPADGSPRVSIPFDDMLSIEFSGRDPAAGRSFQTWVKTYVRKKMAGEAASIESEPLDET